MVKSSLVEDVKVRKAADHVILTSSDVTRGCATSTSSKAQLNRLPQSWTPPHILKLILILIANKVHAFSLLFVLSSDAFIQAQGAGYGFVCPCSLNPVCTLTNFDQQSD